jgi:hypothetical protein
MALRPYRMPLSRVWLQETVKKQSELGVQSLASEHITNCTRLAAFRDIK